MTKELRELEATNLVSRVVYAEVSPKGKYRLSEYGETLLPLLRAVSSGWATRPSLGKWSDCFLGR